MPSKERELGDLGPRLGELAKEGAIEPPMSEDDATGGIPGYRHRREVAKWTWQYMQEYGSHHRPLPPAIVNYLKSVADIINQSLGPSGGLKQKDAWRAIGIDGKAWPKHSPISVYIAMQQWIDDAAWPDITGPKAAAVRYIEERMNDDPNALPDSVIRLYKEGKRLWLSEE